MYTYHNFFVHSSVNGHLGFFHVLAVISNAAVNVGCMYLSKLQFSLDICAGVGLLDHMLGLFLDFKEPSQISPYWLLPIYIPASSIGRFPLLHTVSTFDIFRCFTDDRWDWCEVIHLCSSF